MLWIDVLLYITHLVVKYLREDVDDELLVGLEQVGAEVLCGFLPACLVVVDHLEEEAVHLLFGLGGMDESLDKKTGEFELLKDFLSPLAVAVEVIEQIWHPLVMGHSLETKYFVYL